MPTPLIDIVVPRSPVREHLLTVLQEARAFGIRHVADSARQAIRNAQAAPPDLLLLSTELPDVPWKQVAAHLREVAPEIAVVAVSHCDDVNHVAELLTEGLTGCIAEDEPPDDILNQLDAVARGHVRFSRRVLRKLVASHEPNAVLPDLGERQHDILCLLAQGHDNHQIAAKLLLSEGTVRNYISALYREIGAKSRVEAALWAWRHGVAQAA